MSDSMISPNHLHHHSCVLSGDSGGLCFSLCECEGSCEWEHGIIGKGSAWINDAPENCVFLIWKSVYPPCYLVRSPSAAALEGIICLLHFSLELRNWRARCEEQGFKHFWITNTQSAFKCAHMCSGFNVKLIYLLFLHICLDQIAHSGDTKWSIQRFSDHLLWSLVPYLVSFTVGLLVRCVSPQFISPSQTNWKYVDWLLLCEYVMLCIDLVLIFIPTAPVWSRGFNPIHNGSVWLLDFISSRSEHILFY